MIWSERLQQTWILNYFALKYREKKQGSEAEERNETLNIAQME